KPTLDTIERIVSEETDAPQRLTPEEKKALIVELYDAGVFDLKGAVAEAAAALHLSEQSIYRYLSQIRRMRGE
ncbi:MAG: helix-turn-helix domain-containing protein, partial [Clostridia bacterium]|nr:helix-turn-helix domain-containing protein [Clostridia bacterium]